MIFEIRNYHYMPAKLEAYRQWAQTEAVDFLKAKLDVVGFWIDCGEPPEFRGADPTPAPHGPANVTWIIRWASMEQRKQRHPEVFGSAAWKDIWSRHPDPNAYLHIQVTFAEQI